MDSSYLVSVLIVTYNRIAKLQRCIDSVLRQNCPDLEIVVVDNGSTDSTVETLFQNYPDIRVIRLHTNYGCPSARNVGFANCRGKYIYCLDDDGWLAEDALMSSIRLAEENPKIAVVMSKIILMEKDSDKMHQEGSENSKPVLVHLFSGGRSLIRREALEKVGYYPDDYWRQGEEEPIFLKLTELGYDCILNPASVMYHEPQKTFKNQVEITYYKIRNADRTALRMWPIPWCYLRALKGVFHSIRSGLFFQAPFLCFKLYWDLLLEAAKSPWSSQRISKKAFRRFRSIQNQEGNSLA